MKRKYCVGSLLAVAIALAACSSNKPAPITSAGGEPSGYGGGTGTYSGAHQPMGGHGGTYTVQRGDTLYSVARRNGTDVKTMMDLNGMSSPAINVGQQLRLPGGGGGGSVASTAHDESATSSASVSPAADAKVISWGWPAKGNIIKNYSSTTRGIDIGGSIGDTVRAAASGTVSYVGNGLRGYGNLVLITHSNGFITAYAHNSRITVKNQQHVNKGDKIAELGQSDTTSPRLHFEIRRNGTPVNPLSYLPSR